MSELDSFYDRGAEVGILHETLESYVGAQQSPGSPHARSEGGKEGEGVKNWRKAHNKANRLDSRSIIPSNNLPRLGYSNEGGKVYRLIEFRKGSKGDMETKTLIDKKEYKKTMKVFICLILCTYFFSCTTQKIYRTVNYQKKYDIKIEKIDSTSNNYLLNFRIVNNKDGFLLISPKIKEKNKCNKIKLYSNYKINLKFDSYMSGEYGGYIIDEKEYPITTIIAFSKNLKGLCIKK